MLMRLPGIKVQGELKAVYFHTDNQIALERPLGITPLQAGFPASTENYVETMMKQTIEAFEKRGVQSFYNSLNPAAKKERWQKREAKITERKNKINKKTIEKVIDADDRQLSLFD